MRECDDATMARSAIYVDTTEALHEVGDIVQPLYAQGIAEADVRSTLAQLVQVSVAGRADAQQITCFKAVGSALADLTAAKLVYANAQVAQ
jgi:ornithine cyclodeaminase/alanine dehydrogenase-like protein (mu-crystallin family)